MTYRIPAISKLDDAGDSKTEKVTPGEMESQLSEKAANEFFKMSDCNQPEAAILKYLLRDASRPTSSVAQFTPSIASQLTVVTSSQTKTLAKLNSGVG